MSLSIQNKTGVEKTDFSSRVAAQAEVVVSSDFPKATVREQKIAALKEVMQYQDECVVLNVLEDGLECVHRITTPRVEFNDHYHAPDDHHPDVPHYDGLAGVGRFTSFPHEFRERGFREEYYYYTAYSEKFSDLQSIKRYEAFLVSDDNLSFVGLSGEHRIDFKEGGGLSDVENATKAAKLLVDIQAIDKSIRKDNQENPLEKLRGGPKPSSTNRVR